MIHTYTHAYIHAYIHTYKHTDILLHTCTYKHADIHTYIHAYPILCARSTLAPPFRFSLVPSRAPGLEVSVMLVRQLVGEEKW